MVCLQASLLRAEPDGSPAGSDQRTETGQAEYGARGRAQRVVPGARRLQNEELRETPGAMGDPWRVLEAMPGTVPVISGLPYVYLRGSPPSGTVYLYDEIPVPSLYHLAIGPAAIHPRMIGALTLYSGVAPAHYGRATGGVVAAEGPVRDGDHLEVELRLLDLSAFARTSALGGTLEGAVRYGYPGLVLSLAAPDLSLAYWDYQLRYASQLSQTERLELVALGASDALRVRGRPEDGLAFAYHRFETRYVRQLDQVQLGAALLAGWEHSELGSEIALAATRLGPRVWVERNWEQGHRVRLSADMQAIFGRLHRQSTDSDWIRGDAGLERRVRARSVWGVQLESTLRLGRTLELLAGSRADLWIHGQGFLAALDPRLRLIAHVAPAVRLHLAAGSSHQPAVPFIALPGINDLPLGGRLQSALQGETGVSWDAGNALRAELQVFLHHYRDLAFSDTAILSDACNGRVQEAVGARLMCRSDTMPSPDRVDGYAYGAEVFLRRAPSRGGNALDRVSGFASYTLAFSSLGKVAGLPYTPDWDVRHVGNLMLRWRISDGWSAGLRLFVRSGKSHGEFLLDDQQRLGRFERRLPWFTRIDIEIAYGWRTAWGRMRLALEWLNATLAREPLDLDCSGEPRICVARYLPPIAFPNLGLRGEL